MPWHNPIEHWELEFANQIKHELPNGFTSNIIVGERRRGKSIFVLKNYAKVYNMVEGLKEEECYFKALDCFIFGPKELAKRVLDNTQNDKIDMMWCIDDATVHFNPMVFFINPFLYALLGGIFDTIGTAVNCLALTCPKKKRLMGGLKHYDDVTTQITKAREGGYERQAKGVSWYTWPDGTPHWRIIYDDRYSCYVPDYIYGPYLEKRKMYLKITNDQFVKLMDQLEQRQNKKNLPGIKILKEDMDQLMQSIDSDIVKVKEDGDGTV